jgi:methylthioribulose-1-phosphate dehydratase
MWFVVGHAADVELVEIQMIKGVRVGGMKNALSYLDTLEVPIIENTPHEEDLKESMAEAMKQYPDAPAVLVRRHGIYVWGTACSLRGTTH